MTSAEFGCRAHAADVLHTVHCTLYCGGLVSSRFVSSLEVLACYIAAVVHDVEHPGIHPPSLCDPRGHAACKLRWWCPAYYGLPNTHLPQPCNAQRCGFYKPGVDTCQCFTQVSRMTAWWPHPMTWQCATMTEPSLKATTAAPSHGVRPLDITCTAAALDPSLYLSEGMAQA